MDRNNFNFNAKSYVPKSKTQNDNLEVIKTVVRDNNYNNKKPNNYNKNKNYNNNNYYQEYDQNYYQDNTTYNNNYNNKFTNNTNYNNNYQENTAYTDNYSKGNKSNYKTSYNKGKNNQYHTVTEDYTPSTNTQAYDNYYNKGNSYKPQTNYLSNTSTAYNVANYYNANPNPKATPIPTTTASTNQNTFSAYQYYSSSSVPAKDNFSTYTQYTDYSNSTQHSNKEKPIANITHQDLEDDYFGEEFENININEDDYYDEDLNEDADYYGDFDYNNMMENQNVTPTATPVSYDKETSTSYNRARDPYNITLSNTQSFTHIVERMMNRYNNQPISDYSVNVLMIAEKPSIAQSIAFCLSSGRPTEKRMGRLKVYRFSGYFKNVKANFTVSSVMGHVYTTDFQKDHNKWDNIDFADLFDVDVLKLPADKKSKLTLSLQSLASNQDIVCLWLDCDKEGENISYEVLYSVLPKMNKKKYQQVYRAKFSSLAKPDLKYAFESIQFPPNKNESLAVDARQIIDLKIGVSFTRFLTSAVLPAIQNKELKLLSYGPCQTPTLWFVVNRQQEIDTFRPKEYYTINIEFEYQVAKYKVSLHKHFFLKEELAPILDDLKKHLECTVVKVVSKKNYKQPPAGLNTVQLLRTASSYLKISPHQTMHIAEKLYTGGHITYPRTESTKYASSFEFKTLLNGFSNDKSYGKYAQEILQSFSKPNRGVDVGDHPPITPASTNSSGLKGDYLRLYDFITLHFLASLAKPAEIEEKEYHIQAGYQTFTTKGSFVSYEGFFRMMPFKKNNYERPFPDIKEGTSLKLLKSFFETKYTQPPEKLSESDLIKLMEQNKIGTDASMPTHIQNIVDRNYVDGNRKITPTVLGKCLIEALSSIDKEIVHPNIRADIEFMVDQIAHGKKTYEEVITYSMKIYKDKFLYIRQFYDKIIEKFRKYFQLDTSQVSAISRKIRNKNEEFKMANIKKKNISEIDTDLKKCNDCKNGVLYIDFDQFDKYLLYCTSCKLRKKIVRDAKEIKVLRGSNCAKCDSNCIYVDLENPFLSGETEYSGCLFCDPNLS